MTVTKTDKGILKMPAEGDTYTGYVTACSVDQGNYGEQVMFTFASGDKLYIGKPSADRQLVRCDFIVDGTAPPEVDYAAVAGNTLTFSRDHNAKAPDKPYWGIAVAAWHEAEAKLASKRVDSPYAAPKPTTVPGEGPTPSRPVARQPDTKAGTPRATPDDVSAAYRWALGQSRGAQGADCGPDAYQAGAATILIALDKQGLIPGFAARAFEGAVRKTFDLPDPEGDDLPFDYDKP